MHLGEERGFSLGAASFGALRVALLFGLMGIALALIAVPLVERRSEPPVAGEFDMMTTGSIRRSVLQPSPNATCIIRSDGSRAGQC